MRDFVAWVLQVAPPVVYILCMLTCIACAFLLLRGYRRTKARLLLWSGVCFIGLTINNILLFVDLVILPTTVSLTLPRQFSTLAAVGILVYGLVWDSD